MKRFWFGLAFVTGALCAGSARAQLSLFDLPRVSPHALVSQRIGLTDITVEYHRPAVRGRRIWGNLIPYNKVWRAGANENTTVAFSTRVTIGGRQLDAGTYGLHMIPGKPYWIIVLSRAYRSWGSFTYDPAEDAVRITVMPKTCPHQERLLYTVEDITDTSARVVMRWEQLQVSFEVQVNTPDVVVSSLREQLRGLQRFTWRGWYEAAEWCAHNNTNLDEALGWIERSIHMMPNFSNYMVKALLLDRLNRSDEAEPVREAALKTASEPEIVSFGTDLIMDGLVADAVTVFRKNASMHPDSWVAHDSLADAYLRQGKLKNAKREWKRALKLAPDATQRKRIQRILDKL